MVMVFHDENAYCVVIIECNDDIVRCDMMLIVYMYHVDDVEW